MRHAASQHKETELRPFSWPFGAVLFFLGSLGAEDFAWGRLCVPLSLHSFFCAAVSNRSVIGVGGSRRPALLFAGVICNNFYIVLLRCCCSFLQGDGDWGVVCFDLLPGSCLCCTWGILQTSEVDQQIYLWPLQNSASAVPNGFLITFAQDISYNRLNSPGFRPVLRGVGTGRKLGEEVILYS